MAWYNMQNYRFCLVLIVKFNAVAWGEFNNASALERSLFLRQALQITNEDRYQNNKRPRALMLLNSPLVSFVIACTV